MRIYAKRSRIQRETSRDRLATKLEIGQPDDQYEKEANTMADQVMRMPSVGSEEDKVSPKTTISAIQKQSDEESLQMNVADDNTLQMQPDKESSLQMLPMEEDKISMKGQAAPVQQAAGAKQVRVV